MLSDANNNVFKEIPPAFSNEKWKSREDVYFHSLVWLSLKNIIVTVRITEVKIAESKIKAEQS